VTASSWPPRPTAVPSGRSWPGPDLDALTGLRSGKPSFYPEYRVSAVRLRRVILALERISAALVRTTEGSEALVRAVVDAAADHLSADWVAFALVDGRLSDARPRHLVLGPDGVEWTNLDLVPADVRAHVRCVRDGFPDSTHDRDTARRHLHVPVRLDGHAVGGFVDGPQASVEEADHVLEELAGRFTEAVTRRRRALRTSWQSGGEGTETGSDTERLRLALRDYREMTERLLRL